MKQVVLVLGTFNPITNAHIELGILSASIIKGADIYYVPSNLRFMKQWKNIDGFLTDDERLLLINKSIQKYGFYVSDVELLGYLDGKTYNTVNFFKNELCYNEVYICCGYDKLQELDKWYKAKELVKENKFLVFSRENYSLNDCKNPFVLQHKNRFIEINQNSYSTISSTKVREAYRNNYLEDIKQDIPIVVFEYLQKRNIRK